VVPARFRRRAHRIPGPRAHPALYLIHPDGKGRRRVLSEANIGTPVWSRDGRQLAVAAGYPADIWIIDAVTRAKTRVTQGWRYGYYNRPVRFLEGVPPAILVPGSAVDAAITTDTVVDRVTLKTTAPVNQLAADGSTVAIHYDRGNSPGISSTTTAVSTPGSR
jgi:hypothetical protein